jgi:5-methylcytosine-specific restriction endonuclease McrA
MTAILLLNADMRPIRTLPLKRAVSLLSKGAVDVVEAVPGRELRSATTTQPFPSVLRLRYYVNVPQRNAVWSRRAVFSRDGYTCVFCGEHLNRETATVDHLIPQETCRKQGIRASTWSNTVTACENCNRRKANKTMRDAGMKFFNEKYIPKTPRANYLVVSGEVPVEWKFYLGG